MVETPETPVGRVRAYYRALDGGEYDLLAALLVPEFVHERPDRTLEGREQFVRFMREERPVTDTSHPIDGVYRRVEDGETPAAELVARGRLLGPDGDELTGFVDVFSFEDGQIARIRTYAD